MKTFSQFLDEALASFLVKAAARSLLRNKTLIKQVAQKTGTLPKKLEYTRLYHGTTKPVSQQISRSGWRTDANVTRQMTGSGVYTTPQKSAAQMYANQRAIQRGESPALRTFRLPTSTFNKVKTQRQQRGEWKFEKGGQRFNTVQMTPNAANRYDITDKPQSAIDLTSTQKQELRKRISTGFEDPRAIPTLKRELGIKPKPQLKVTQVPSVASSNPYRNLGVGRRESVKEAKTFSEFITEANRRAQRASKAGRKPKEGERSRSTEKPSAVVTVGLPGSGKSTIAKHMVSKGNTDQHELDKSRQALGKGPAYFGSDIVQHTYSGAKKSAEQGRNTVLSNTSIPRQHRQDAIDKLKDSGYENVTAVLSPGSTKAAMRRNRKRTGSKPGEGAVPQFVMNRMAQGMQQMSRDERRELRSNYKKLHKKERFTKPAMRRSGAIRSAQSQSSTNN